jgi:hypothetical protein
MIFYYFALNVRNISILEGNDKLSKKLLNNQKLLEYQVHIKNFILFVLSIIQ